MLKAEKRMTLGRGKGHSSRPGITELQGLGRNVPYLGPVFGQEHSHQVLPDTF